jgi:hypothetical protein
VKQQGRGKRKLIRKQKQICLLEEGVMWAIHYKPMNYYNRSPVTSKVTGRKRIKAATSLRPSFINGNKSNKKPEKNKK